MHDYELNSLYRCTYVYPTVWFGQRTGPAEVRDIKRCQKGFLFFVFINLDGLETGTKNASRRHWMKGDVRNCPTI